MNGGKSGRVVLTADTHVPFNVGVGRTRHWGDTSLADAEGREFS